MKNVELAQRRTSVIAVVLVLVVALVAVVTFVGIGRGPAVSSPPPAAQAEPPTVPQLIMQRHADRDGLLDFEGALEMFSYAFEPLPGVTLPAGPADSTHSWTDLAMHSILPHVSELTSAQVAVVGSFLVPAKAAAVGPRPTSGTRLASYLATVNLPTVQSNIEAAVAAAVKAEAIKLGHSLADSPANASPGTIHVVLTAKEMVSKTGLAPAWTITSKGPVTIDETHLDDPTVDDAKKIHADLTSKVSDCTIFFGPSEWTSVDSSGTWAPSAFQRASVYHEVFHCYQGFVLGSKTGDAANSAPDWVAEGSAEWAMDSATGYDDPWWTDYGPKPSRTLDKRGYDAFGLFFEIEYLGRPLWPEWWQIWSDGAKGGWTTTDWFNNVAGDHLNALRQAWGASFFGDSSRGHDWTETAPGQTMAAHAGRIPFVDQLERSADPYSTLQVDIPAQPDGTVVIADALGATGRWLDAAHNEGMDASRVSLCWGGSASCTCPSTGATTPGKLTQVTGAVSWAMTALQGGGDAVVRKGTLTQFCKEPSQPSVRPPCRAGCAGSNGDPHLRTVNGRRYDFQAAGEFTLLRSADKSLEIQARQEPLSGSLTAGVTINTAVAARIGTHRVGVYVGSAGLQIHVDGTPVVPAGPIELDGGGSITVHPNGIEIDSPGGTALWALPIGNFGIGVLVAPSPEVASSAGGLLGAAAPGYDLPRLPDGTALPFDTPAPARYHYIYHEFAAAWRVTDQTSLFDYVNGSSTATYDVPGFLPEAGAQAPIRLDPAQRAEAESACTGIDDVELRVACVFDVTVSQNTGFVAGYQNTAAFQATGVTALDSGSPSAGATEPPSASPSAASSESTGAVGQIVISRLLDEVSLVRGTALSPAGILYVMAEQSDRTMILRMDTNQVEPSADVAITPPISVLDGLAFARDSVWAVERSGTGSCSVTQEMGGPAVPIVAAVTLSGCPDGSPVIAATTDAIWVQDGPSSGTSRLDRIDPATGKVTGSVPLPAGSGGAVSASATTAFWTSSTGVFQINPATMTADMLVASAINSVPSGDHIWVQRDAGTAVLLDGTGATLATLKVDGTIAGADPTDVYVVRLSSQGLQELWQYPVNGSAAVLVAPSTPVTGVIPEWAVSATAHAPLLVGDRFVIQAIAQSPGSPQPLELQLETVRIK